MVEAEKTVNKAAKKSVEKAATNAVNKVAAQSVEKPVKKVAKAPVKKAAAAAPEKKVAKAAEKKAAKTSAGESAKLLSLTLIRSRHGRLAAHKACVAGLGLRKIHQTVQVIDTPENRGMIDKVHYLLNVEEV